MALKMDDPLPEIKLGNLNPGYPRIVEGFMAERFPAFKDQFAKEATRWLKMEQAMSNTRKSRRTIQSWHAQGLIRSRTMKSGHKEFNLVTLTYAFNLAAYRYKYRRVVAGPGRGHKGISPA